MIGCVFFFIVINFYFCGIFVDIVDYVVCDGFFFACCNMQNQFVEVLMFQDVDMVCCVRVILWVEFFGFMWYFYDCDFRFVRVVLFYILVFVVYVFCVYQVDSVVIFVYDDVVIDDVFCYGCVDCDVEVCEERLVWCMILVFFFCWFFDFIEVVDFEIWCIGKIGFKWIDLFVGIEVVFLYFCSCVCDVM